MARIPNFFGYFSIEVAAKIIAWTTMFIGVMNIVSFIISCTLQPHVMAVSLFGTYWPTSLIMFLCVRLPRAILAFRMLQKPLEV